MSAAACTVNGHRMVRLDGGLFTMGSDDFYPEEAPAHQVTVSAFCIDEHPVTNAQFRSFVDATGYVTTAEIAPDPRDYPGARPELLVPGSAVFVPPPGPVDLRNPGQWWAYVPGADWRHPTGPDSGIEGKDGHPVVQVTFADAQAYVAWAGLALPTEAQWEFAARGGLEAQPWAWGIGKLVDGTVPANTWVGEFPWRSDHPDGAWGTVPVGSFPPNGYGLSDVCGQVWEWTTDWWRAAHEPKGACCAPKVDPAGPADPGFDPHAPSIGQRVLKGGSFLCADNYCMRYRPSARIAESVDTSTCHVGFRCVAPAV
jgi:formylglycine-generating enzyme required for sulfatase activity